MPRRFLSISDNFDFLRALYAHARQVFKALEEKQQTLQAHVGSQQRTYFSVLEECSPSMTLLKLILHDHVPPNKLEEFAAKMKLNITQCVSKEVRGSWNQFFSVNRIEKFSSVIRQESTCGSTRRCFIRFQILPNIYMRPASYNDSLQVRVLNADNGSAGLTHRSSQTQFSRNAAFVAKKLLSQIIDIIAEKSGGKLVIEKCGKASFLSFTIPISRSDILDEISIFGNTLLFSRSNFARVFFSLRKSPFKCASSKDRTVK